VYRFGVPFTPSTHPFISTMTDSTQKPSNPKDLIGSTKPALSTLPCPVLFEVGAAMTEGTKYGRHNYRVVGVRASVYYDAAMRHLMSYWEGDDIDPDSGLPHLAKAMACLVILRDAEINRKLADDRPPRARPGWMKAAQLNTTRVLEKIKGKVLPPYTQANIDLADPDRALILDDDFEFNEG